MVGSLVVAYATNTAVAAFTLAQTAAAFAINFAVSQIVTRVFADNPERQQDMGVRQQVPPSAVNAIPIVYGNAYMGGTFVDAVLTTDQKTMYYVMAISSISPDGQFTFDTTDMYYGDRKIAFDGTDLTKVVSLTDEAGNVDTKISGNLFINLYRSDAAGTITPLNGAAAPSTVMGGSDIAVAQRWTGTRQMNGLGFAIVKLIYNRDAGTTQLSPITFKVAHTLRGTGVAKPGDVWYDYITNTIYGGAVNPTFVDSTSRTTLNAYSDALITFTNSGGSPSTQPRYRINGVLDAGESVLSNIDRIMSACDSWMAYNAALGQWAVVVNKPETAEFAFTDNNIIGDIRVSATDITSSINQVEARFPFKENRDQANFINIQTPSGLLYPNEPVNKYSITYDLVNDSVQASYLANRLLEQAREDLIVSFNTTYFGIQVDAGDVVSVTNSDYGWNAKLFRVMKVNEASLPDGSLGARLELSEYNAQVYDDQTINQFAPVPNSGLANVGFFSNLTAPTVTGFPSVTVPYFNVVVAIPATGRVTFVDLYYTTTPTPTASDWKLLSTATSADSQPFTNSSSFTFGNQILPSGTYYFGYLVGNEIGQSKISPLSTSFAWTPTGTTGPFVDISGVTTFSKTSSNVYTPATATLNAVTENITSPTYAWVITGATPTSGSLSSITITPNSAATSVVAQLTVNGSNLSAPIVKSVTMAIIVQADKYDQAYLYQWSTATPGNPSGTSTYTWATGANSSYTGGNGWSTTVPVNPGTPGLFLWIASKQVVDTPTAATTTVSWTSGFSIQTNTENGANGVSGVQNATPTVYQWAATIPTISGTSTYTWATGSFTPVPSGWSAAPGTATPGFTLWAASVRLVDSATVSTSTINWTTASIRAESYAGTNGTPGTPGVDGSSSRICFARVPSNPSPVSGTIITTGNSSFPSSGQSSSTWGFSATWVAADPNPSSTDSLYQSDGIYNPSTNQTSWGTPYISSLKVGSLSAITVNTGALTVTGNFQANTAAISGTTMTGSGGILYPSGNFAFGNSSTNITFNGSALNLNGSVVSVGSLRNNTSGTFNTVTFGLGTGSTLGPYTAGGIFASTDVTHFGLIVTHTASGTAIAAGTTATTESGAAIGAVGSSNSSFSLWRNQGSIGTGGSGGSFQTNGSGFLQSGVAADIRLAHFTGGVSYASYIYSGAVFPFTAGHDALQLLTEDVPEIGDLMVDVQLISADGINDTITQMSPSTTANQLGVVGVFIGVNGNDFVPAALAEYVESPSTTKTQIQFKPEYADIYDTYRSIGVNAIGEGKINVCGQGGDISIGDFICSSNTLGKGMKQADDLFHSYTVAKARENVTFSSPTEVKQIACIYMGG
jgi:hypothetical protein